MTTFGELLADIRQDVQDTSSNPRWSDELIHMYIKDALADYSTWFPRYVARVALVSDVDGYALPADFLEDVLVECPQDTFLERRHVRPGVVYRATPSPKYYYIVSGKLILSAAADSDVLLSYQAAHPAPPADTETDFVITVPDSDLELIRLFVKAKIHEQMRAKTARQDRFDQGSGRRDDNPITPEAANLMREYRQRIYDRMPGGAIKLYRVGKVR